MSGQAGEASPVHEHLHPPLCRQVLLLLPRHIRLQRHSITAGPGVVTVS